MGVVALHDVSCAQTRLIWYSKHALKKGMTLDQQACSDERHDTRSARML